MRGTRLGAALVAALVLTLGLTVGPRPARASSFEVYPLLVQTSTGLGAVTVHNPGPDRLYIEAELLVWTQSAAGAPVLTPDPALLVSPPGTWIGPNQDYRFRLLVPAAHAGKEGSYRLLLRQLPSESDIGAGKVLFTITQSLPVFAEPRHLSPPQLSASLSPDGTLMLRNSGERRARIADLAQGGRVLIRGLAGYALGGSVLALRKLPVHPGKISFSTDLGPRTLVVPPSAR